MGQVFISLNIQTCEEIAATNAPCRLPGVRNHGSKFARLTDCRYRLAMIEATAPAAVATAAPPRYTRANPFPARLVVNRRLSGPESEKDTRHFEVDLTGWGLSFE